MLTDVTAFAPATVDAMYREYLAQYLFTADIRQMQVEQDHVRPVLARTSQVGRRIPLPRPPCKRFLGSLVRFHFP